MNEEGRITLLASLFASEYSILRCSMEYLLSNLNLQELHELLNNFEEKLPSKELVLGENTLNTLQVSLGDTSIKLSITLASSSDELNQAIQNINSCYHGEIGHLLFKHLLNNYDKNEVYHYFVKCDDTPNACKFKATSDDTHLDVKYISYNKDNLDDYSCLTCKNFNDLQVSNLHGPDDIMCGDEIHNYNNLIVLKFNGVHHLVSLNCNGDSNTCLNIKHN